ncbi:MAG: spore coat protein [Clostridia bacterium]|nr:spore coat protein [Clostridia bacterium]
MFSVSTVFGDQEILSDALSTQKQITGSYNTITNECSSCALMTDLLGILADEHNIQHDVFEQMQAHGWYQTQPAPAQNIKDALCKFEGISVLI